MMTDLPSCKTCGEPVKRRKSMYCSVSCAKKDPEVQARFEKTCLERYGFKSPASNQHVREKRTRTMIERHGYSSPMELESVRNKARKTIFERYGVHHQTLRKIAVTREELEKSYVDDRMTCSEIAEEHGATRDWAQRALREHGIQTRKSHRQSRHERDLASRLRAKGLVVKENDRSVIPPKEIDLWLPEHSLGVEMNGLFWHSGDRKRHAEKYGTCSEAGVRLLQVFDCEWDERPDFFERFILDQAGLFDEVLGARECSVERVPVPEARAFAEANHVQGWSPARVVFGLRHRSLGLVHLTSFGRPRFARNYQWEVVRSVSAAGVAVRGGFSRAFTAFRREVEPRSVVTYCDRRFFTGKSYVASGFTHVRETAPGYFYFSKRPGEYRLLPRYAFQKSKLASVLPGFDPSLTEVENMEAAGYSRVWDAGHGVYEWIEKLASPPLKSSVQLPETG